MRLVLRFSLGPLGQCTACGRVWQRSFYTSWRSGHIEGTHKGPGQDIVSRVMLAANFFLQLWPPSCLSPLPSRANLLLRSEPSWCSHLRSPPFTDTSGGLLVSSLGTSESNQVGNEITCHVFFQTRSDSLRFSMAFFSASRSTQWGGSQFLGY